MTSPVSSLATAKEPRVNLGYIEHELEVQTGGIVPYVRLTVEARDLWVAWTRDLLAALDSLDGTILLTRDEAEEIVWTLSQLTASSHDEHSERESHIALLAARIEEARG